MALTYKEFLEKIVEKGIAAATADYHKDDPITKARLEGSIEGFNACLDQSPSEIIELLWKVRAEQMAIFGGDDDVLYWKTTCKAAEIEWVLNVLGCGLSLELGVPHTARGVLTAADILGVRGVEQVQ